MIVMIQINIQRSDLRNADLCSTPLDERGSWRKSIKR